MKKFLSVLGVLVLAIALVGCTPEMPGDDVMDDGQEDAQAETGDEVAVDDNGADDAMDDEDEMDDEGEMDDDTDESDDDDADDDESDEDDDSMTGEGEVIVDSETNLRILGTEPFWSVLITEDSIEWSEPTDEGIEEVEFAGLTVSEDGEMTIYQDADMNISVAISEAEESCSDGMSDTAYPYEATVQYEGTVYEGCAETEGVE